jgi:hypothetical protein
MEKLPEFELGGQIMKGRILRLEPEIPRNDRGFLVIFLFFQRLARHMQCNRHNTSQALIGC